MSIALLTSLKTLPWNSIAKTAGIIGGVALLLWAGYTKGDGDRNAKWLVIENSRILAESDARIKALETAHGLNIQSVKESADALARADERIKAAKQRADDAETSRNATRRQNNVLFSDLKSAQDAALQAGDNAGRSLMPVIVRNQTANGLDKICRRRPAECGRGAESGTGNQNSATDANIRENLAGGYPNP